MLAQIKRCQELTRSTKIREALGVPMKSSIQEQCRLNFIDKMQLMQTHAFALVLRYHKVILCESI